MFLRPWKMEIFNAKVRTFSINILAHWAEFSKKYFLINTYIPTLSVKIEIFMNIYINIPYWGQKPDPTFLRYLFVEFFHESDFGN